MDLYSIKILLCDDSLLIRNKLKGILHENGFHNVLEAEDGQIAIDMCKVQRPDIVFLDIVMPVKDGLEALVEIKQFDPTIQVVMASSVGTQLNLLKALKLGASNFVQKPINYEAVHEILINFIKERSDV